MGVGRMRREGSWMFRQRGTGGMWQAGGGATIILREYCRRERTGLSEPEGETVRGRLGRDKRGG